jgi:GNAT superfamily N-acetyltransferase
MDAMDYDLDDDPARVQHDVVWAWLSTEAYWGRWRTRADVETQVANAWRVVGAYRRDTGEQVGFARAVSDGVAFAYLADVFVLDAHRGHGLGKRLLRLMIDDGPGRDLRWTLFPRRRARPVPAVRLRRARRDRDGAAGVRPPHRRVTDAATRGIRLSGGQRWRRSRTRMLMTIGVPSKP